jgi:hypothetical protein
MESMKAFHGEKTVMVVEDIKVVSGDDGTCTKMLQVRK